MNDISRRDVIIYSILGILLLVGVGFAVWYFTIRPLATSSQMKLVGTLNKDSNTELEANIDSFIEADKSMTCAHIYYGSDDKYVYSFMQCAHYTNTDGVISSSDGFSVPTRFEYDKSTLTVNAYKQPTEGDTYNSTLNQIFPTEIIASIKDTTVQSISDLEAKTRTKYLESINGTSDQSSTTDQTSIDPSANL